MNKHEQHPSIMEIIELVALHNPLQRKRINSFVSSQGEDYWIFAESLSQTLNYSFLQDEQDRIEAARAYNKMCLDILREQIRFRKTGTYLINSDTVAAETVYNQHDVMRGYITGLLFSYLFWPNHYKMFAFFKKHLLNINIERCLEVGVGHGLFTAETIRHFPEVEMTLVDISKTSLEVASELLRTFQLDLVNVSFVHHNYLTLPLEYEGFDLIIMGEVLEHVNEALTFLVKARQLLRLGGTIFLSTCVNCPAVDHVYHFHTVSEIQSLIKEANLAIVQELFLPAENVPEVKWEEELVTINYCAILTHQ